MKELAKLFWNEPAIALGVLAAAALAAGEAFLGDGLQASDFPAIATVVGASGLIRQFVSPAK